MAEGVRVSRVSFAVCEFSSVGVIASWGSETEGQEISSEASTRNPNPNKKCAQLVPRRSARGYGSSVPPPLLCPKDSSNGQDGAALEPAARPTLTLAADRAPRPPSLKFPRLARAATARRAAPKAVSNFRANRTRSARATDRTAHQTLTLAAEPCCKLSAASPASEAARLPASLPAALHSLHSLQARVRVRDPLLFAPRRPGPGIVDFVVADVGGEEEEET